MVSFSILSVFRARSRLDLSHTGGDHELRRHLADCVRCGSQTGTVRLQADSTGEARGLSSKIDDAEKSENGLSSEALLAAPGGTALVQGHEARVGPQRRVAVVWGQASVVPADRADSASVSARFRTSTL